MDGQLTFNFGKYNGQLVDDVLRRNPWYCSTILEHYDASFASLGHLVGGSTPLTSLTDEERRTVLYLQKARVIMLHLRNHFHPKLVDKSG